MSQNKVCILGWYGSPNVGDEAELAAILAQLATLPQPPQATVFSTKPAITRRRFSAYPGGLNVLPRSPQSPAAWQALKTARLLIFGGGGLIQDQTSIYNLLLFTVFAALAKVCGAKVMLWGVGAEPIVTGFGRWQAQRIIGWCAPGAAGVRDDESLEILAAAGVPRQQLHVTADPAITLPPAGAARLEALLSEAGLSSDKSTNEPLVIFCLRDLPNNPKGRGLGYMLPVALQKRFSGHKTPDQGYQEAVAAFYHKMAETADHLIDAHNARILFLPFWAGRDDAIAAEVRALMRHADQTHSIDQYLEPRLARALVGKADLVVAVRLHPLIFAAAAGVPAVGFTYARKIKGFLARINASDQAFDTNELDAQALETLLDDLLARGFSKTAEVKELQALAQNDLRTCEAILKG